MRVALVIQKLAGLRGGAERVVADLASALAARGHDVTIVTYEASSGAGGYETPGVPVVDVLPRPLGAVLRRTRSSGRLDASEQVVSTAANRGLLAQLKWQLTHGLFGRRLASWLRQHRHDVVVGFLPPAISAVALAGDRLGDERPRIIASTHNLPAVDLGVGGRWDQNPVARRTNLWALGAADAVTVLQPEFVAQLPEAARGHAVVLPDPVSRLAAPSGASRRNLILGVGRLTDVKRYDLLIEAFARIADEFPDWDLMICGDGPERQRLLELVLAHSLVDRVTLPGAVVDIAAQYDSARILGHPARYEGFGLAVAEAIVHGLPVVAFADCPGVNRLVEDGITGVLVDARDDAAATFADGLRRLISDPPPLQLLEAGARRLAERHAPDRVYDEWERILGVC